MNVTTNNAETLRALLEAAYRQGAHDYSGQGWDTVDRDELADVAADYAADVDLAALASQPQAAGVGGDADLPRDDETEDEYLIRRLSTLLAEIAVIINGPEPALTSWSYHDLPDLVRALKARVPPVRNLPPNPPPAKPARVVVTHEIAARGADWLREDMLVLADGIVPPPAPTPGRGGEDLR